MALREEGAPTFIQANPLPFLDKRGLFKGQCRFLTEMGME